MSASTARGLRVIKAMQEYKKAYLNQFDTGTVLQKLNLLHLSDNSARASFVVDQQMCNVMRTLHGGFTASVMDVLMVTHIIARQNGKLAWTTNLNIHYLSSATLGQQVNVESTPIKVTKSFVLMEGKAINDATGHLIAKSLVTFLPGPDKSQQEFGEAVLKLDFSRND